MITRFSIVTLVLFFISTALVIQPVSFHVSVPFLGRRRMTVGLMTAPILTIGILWAAQCLGATQIRNGIVGTDGIKPYNILILFISLAYMAITLDGTGILRAAAFWVSNKGGSRGRRLYLYFYLLLTSVSMILGNDPIILSGTPFLVYYTEATKLEPIPWLMMEFAAANTASMVLFVGNPTNVVICEGFLINNAAFTAYTILPFLACCITCYAVLVVLFRDEKHIPRKLPDVEQLDARKALRDVVGAWVGGIMLVTCLIVVLVLSFIHVDVWKVVLPFAGAKFIFDMSWDHYRFKTGRLHAAAAAEEEMMLEIIRATGGDTERVRTFNSITLGDAVAINGSEIANESAAGNDLGNATNSIHAPNAPTSFPKTTGDTYNTQKSELQSHWTSKKAAYDATYNSWAAHFPTFFTALPRLPFGLIPFAFSQFILIEALSHQGWIEVFSGWLIHATGRKMFPTIWIIGVLGVILCNIAGTNIGATILLTKIVHAAPNFPVSSAKAAAIALAVSSNIGAVSFTFSASLAGLLWDTILKQKGIETINQRTFAKWNIMPIFFMTSVGLAIVSAEVSILY
ncbi:arsenical pump membrane protein-domain-containing protein [Cyathus striatus]|nr:arsenical pump membrane protein-domain-containing protein [Cyathus striatus]